jgi:AraC family transcriptional regulator
MRTHAHDEAGFVLALAGTGELDYGGQTHVCEPGSLTFLPAGEPHANRFLGGVRCFEIMLGSPWLDRFGEAFSAIERPTAFRNAAPVQVATRLREEVRSPDALSALAVEGLVTDLLVQTARNADFAQERRAPVWLRRAKEYLHAHFAEDLSLTVVAAEAGVHPGHLTRAFRQHYHASVTEYVRALRIESACRLLATSDVPIAQIALDLGFADQGHFTRRFKARLGVTPGAFRTRSKNARFG